MKVDRTVKTETLYIAAWTLIFSAVQQAVFLILGFWSPQVLFGNLLSAGVGILNFFLLGLTVQRAVLMEPKEAKSMMRASGGVRLLLLFCAALLGAVVPVFHLWATLIPLFFPRLAVMLRPLFMKKEQSAADTPENKEDNGDA